MPGFPNVCLQVVRVVIFQLSCFSVVAVEVVAFVAVAAARHAGEIEARVAAAQVARKDAL